MIYIYIPVMGDGPVGGVRTLFDYAMRLNEIESNAVSILSDGNTFYSWLPKEYQKIQILPTSTLVTSQDTIIIPEVCPAKISLYANAGKKALAVLNWKYFENNTKKDLVSMGYNLVLTNSQFTKKFVERTVKKIPVVHIPMFIDTTVYFNAKPFSKRTFNSIVLLNRKNNKLITKIVDYLKDKNHKLTVINNLHPAVLATIYKENQIFINLGYPEGFCRPAAEAMASGCVVIGFTGGGGTDFMKNTSNSFTVEDGNAQQLISVLDTVLHEISLDAKEKITVEGQKTIKSNYSKYNQGKTLYSVFEYAFSKKMSAKKLHAIFSVKARTRKYTISEKDVLLYQLTTQNKRFRDREFLNDEYFVDSSVFKIWRTYRNVVERKYRFSSPLSFIKENFQSFLKM